VKLITRFRDLPLRRQLMLAFSLLATTTTVIVTVTLSSLASHRMNTGLRDKSVQYAKQLQLQLAPVVAFDDHLTARELFQSLLSDQDVDGLAVFAEDGALLEGWGSYPLALNSVDATLPSGKGHVIAVAGVRSREGRLGRVYVSLTSTPIAALQQRDAWIAAGIAMGVSFSALLLAVLISKLIARRLVVIAEAANRVASGELTQPNLDDRARDEIGALAHSFNVMVADLRSLTEERSQSATHTRERLEKLVLERTQDLEQSREMFKLMALSTKAVPFTLDLKRGAFPYMGEQGIGEKRLFGAEWCEPGALEQAIPREANPEIRRCFDECKAGPFEFLAPFTRSDDVRSEMRWSGTCELTADRKVLRGLVQDVTEFRRLARDLAAAQKLESVGRLAAGVAHEINTPVQFVSDNVQFVRSTISDLGPVISAYRKMRRALAAGGDALGAATEAAEAEAAADLDYVIENVPLAVDSAIDGLSRIATIVRSMKQFAHPDQGRKSYADLNQAIQSTLVIARNEYKYVARLETEFGELPPVPCYLGEINQVILNLIVNAAHAIADLVKDNSQLGLLAIRTRQVGDEVEIAIADSGTGIPVEIRERVFDPFFTTKEVGKGTGQGLALAHSVVVGKHGGTLRFESECGKGTTFYIRLPLDDASTTDASERLEMRTH
jgi:signal transduction histidine kinase/HAMP domain-containing protein